jgi:hypothetical protein
MNNSPNSARRARATELNDNSVRDERKSNAGGVDFMPLSRKFPQLAKQWHAIKNGQCTADDFSPGSDVIAWWQCEVGADHTWQAAIFSRTAGKGCPYCANKKVSVTNSFVTLFPQVAQEWNVTRNVGIDINEMTCRSRKKVWWLCENNSEHQWQAEVSRRVDGSGCPYCSNQRASRENCLWTKFPDIAAQLHPTKNDTVNGESLTSASSKKVWWLCTENGHEWQATVANRTSKNSGCPHCLAMKRTKL